MAMKRGAIMMLLALSGCAETYGSTGSGIRLFGGGGHSAKQLSADTWDVRYNGTDYRWTYDSALYRAAEIAQKNGFASFAAVRKSSQMVPIYANNRYVGTSQFVTLTMRGYNGGMGPCPGDVAICDRYDTATTLQRLAR